MLRANVARQKGNCEAVWGDYADAEGGAAGKIVGALRWRNPSAGRLVEGLIGNETSYLAGAVFGLALVAARRFSQSAFMR